MSHIFRGSVVAALAIAGSIPFCSGGGASTNDSALDAGVQGMDAEFPFVDDEALNLMSLRTLKSSSGNGASPYPVNTSFPVSATNCSVPTCDGHSAAGLQKLGREVTTADWCSSVMRGCGFVMMHICAAETSDSWHGKLLMMLSIVTGSCKDCVGRLQQMGCVECGCKAYDSNAATAALGCCV
mmetsp:Transcript_62204/g.158166  ORF Transcript_62204/g.158166 Transcript_62204/m.158166 type:complete len:183 (+) Transcript_62204:77-625(+)